MGDPDEEPAGNGGVTHSGRTPRLAARDLVSGDAVDVVAQLKEASEVPLRSHGSLSMNRALMAAGLVDRVQVTLFPVITGRTGVDRIFQGAADFDLDLIESRTLDGNIQELLYRPTLHL
jgi:dihydrofolate reductase